MGSGSNAKNYMEGNAGIKGLNEQAEQIQDPRLAKILGNYSSGGASLEDALKSLRGEDEIYGQSAYKAQLEGRVSELQKALQADIQAKAASRVNGQRFDSQQGSLESQIRDTQAELNKQIDNGRGMGSIARINELFTNPLTGTKVASEQVQNNPLLSGIFGKGGLNDRLLTEEQDLATRGWSLQPEDHEAYGQASDEIARLAGQEDASLMSVLNARGMASGASGAAAAGYSGLAGNKMERLKATQLQLADKRMQMNKQRLDSVRNFAMQGNQQAQQAIGDQFRANMAGTEAYSNKLKDSVSAAQMQQGQENAQFEQRESTRGPSAGEIGMGLLGTAVGSAAGGLGAGVGGTLGKGLGASLLGGSDKDALMPTKTYAASRYDPRKIG